MTGGVVTAHRAGHSERRLADGGETVSIDSP